MRKNLCMQRETEREKRETNESRKYNMRNFAKIQIPQQIKQSQKSKLANSPTLIHQLFMTKAVFCLLTAVGY